MSPRRLIWKHFHPVFEFMEICHFHNIAIHKHCTYHNARATLQGGNASRSRTCQGHSQYCYWAPIMEHGWWECRQSSHRMGEWVNFRETIPTWLCFKRCTGVKNVQNSTWWQSLFSSTELSVEWTTFFPLEAGWLKRF